MSIQRFLSKLLYAFLWSAFTCAMAGGTRAETAPDPAQIEKAVSETLSACTIGPTAQTSAALRKELPGFLSGIAQKGSTDWKDLDAIFAKAPTDHGDAQKDMPDGRDRQVFFSLYFRCIRDQLRLKIVQLGLPAAPQ